MAGAKADCRVRVFLSYGRDDDEPFVRRLYEDLVKARFQLDKGEARFDVWFDRVSMPSRQLTFHQEIRDAVAACDRLVLVVGPDAVDSEYVRQEWRFAFFEAGKCVNPIVRVNGRDASGMVVDGYRLIPEELRLIHAEDFRKDSRYPAHLANLVRQLSDRLPPPGKLIAVPELPPHYREHPERLKALRDLVLADLQKPVVVTGAAARVGLSGMPGIGKSLLASALARHPEVRRAFPDGVYWVSFGQQPKLADLQRRLAKHLGDRGDFVDLDAGKERLRELLASRKALLILDNVWRRSDAEAFNIAGPVSRILLTTRDIGLVTALTSHENHYQVQLPTPTEAAMILAAAAHVHADELTPTARRVIEECGRLPLALALCGGMVRGGTPWRDLLAALKEHDLHYLAADHPLEEQHASIWRAIDLSIRALDEPERERFAELAVFVPNAGAPSETIAMLWEHTAKLSARDARKLLSKLAMRSLVQFTERGSDKDLETARVSLHDLLHDFAIGMASTMFGSPVALHIKLLNAYRRKCPKGWPSGPNDGYFLQNLCGHLLAAKRVERAVTLLTDPHWLEANGRTGLVFDLQEDYRNVITALPEAQRGLRRQRANEARLARWTEEITEYARQWSERRVRLLNGDSVTEPEPVFPEIVPSIKPWSNKQIKDECRHVLENPTRLNRLRAFADFVESECYPLSEFGNRPGFVLQQSFNRLPGDPVQKAAAGLIKLPGVPLFLRRWPHTARHNPTPALLRTLHGHSSYVTEVSVTPDGRRAVSGSVDHTLRVWDLATGQCLHILEGHSEQTTGVHVTSDGRRAVSGSWDKTLRVWDLESGTCVRTLEGHSGWVKSVSVTPDGGMAISGSADNSVRFWDLESGRCLRTLEGYDGSVEWIAPNGREALLAGDGDTLRMLDLATGHSLRELAGRHGQIGDATPNGRLAVSRSGDKAYVLDMASGKCLRILKGHSGWVHDVSVTPDGQLAVSAGEDKTVRVWDVSNGRCLRILEGHTGWVVTVRVTADGRHAVSGGVDKTLRVWDLAEGRSVRSFVGHSRPVHRVRLTADGRLAVSASAEGNTPREGGMGDVMPPIVKDNVLWVWDCTRAKCVRMLKGHSDEILSMGITPDGRLAVSGSMDETLRVWDLKAGRCLRVLRGIPRVLRGKPNHLSGRSRTYAVSAPCVAVCVTSDGRLAVSNGESDALRIWDLASGRCLRSVKGPYDYSISMSMTADARLVVSAGEGMARVWDLESGHCLHVLKEPHDSATLGVSITPDGRAAVTGSWDKTVRVWDVSSGKRLWTLEGHKGPVESVGVSEDGRLAVSASTDTTLRLWDLARGKCLGVVFADTPWVAVAIAADCRRVVAGSLTGEVAFFDVSALVDA